MDGAEAAEGVYAEAAALEWLSGQGVPTVARRFAASADEAVRAAVEFGPTVVLKVASPLAIHKSDLGGVRTGLTGPDAVRAAFDDLVAAHRLAYQGANPDGVLVQPMIDGVQVLVGVRRDPSLGPFVVVGAGGVDAELIDDTAIARAPLDTVAAAELLDSVRVSRLLGGHRGRDPVRPDGLIDAIVAVSCLAGAHPEVTELDLNPVIVGPHGAVAVDARMVVERPPAPVPSPRGLPTELFTPRNIAVIGASRDDHKPGGRALRYLLRHGYPGSVYAVNARASTVQGVPSVASVGELAGKGIDLACISVPAENVLDVLRDCVKLRIPAAVVYGAGFEDRSTSGAELRRGVHAASSDGEQPIRYVGPNSNGLLSTDPPVCAAIGMAFELDPAPAGTVAMISQSGAIGSSLLSRGWDVGIGFSRWVSTGNELDIGIAEYLDFLADDPRTEVILAFVEGIDDGDAFAEAVRRCGKAGKPVVVYKAGVSDTGRQAVVSHTGRIAGDERLYDAYLADIGVVRVRSLQTFLDAGRVLPRYPEPSGNRVGVLTLSGGASSIVADECHAVGLAVPPFGPSMRDRLHALVPAFGAVHNPVDVTAEGITEPKRLLDGIVEVLASDEVDLVMVQLTTNAEPSASMIAEGLVRITRRAAKPVLVSRLGSSLLAPNAMRIYGSAGIPVFDSPERLVAAADVLVRCAAVDRSTSVRRLGS